MTTLPSAPEPRWPRDARAACAFTFDLDAETLWMARGVHEPVALSQGRFGPVEALPRILALLRECRVQNVQVAPNVVRPEPSTRLNWLTGKSMRKLLGTVLR
jgi:hypothetical protein